MTLLIGLEMMPISVGQPIGVRPGLVRGSTWMLRNSLSAGGASAIRDRAARFQMLTTRSRRAVAVLGVVLATAVGGCTGGSEQGTSAAPASSSAATATGTVDDRAARSDQLLASMLAADQPGCSAAVAIDGQVVWEGARGLANLDQRTPLTTDTRFDIGSVAKQFTATAILLLSFDGALTLQDPVSRYVPGLPTWGDQVSIDQLIHHTSGIPDYMEHFTTSGVSYDTPTTQQDAIRAIAGMTDLTATPGETFEYSGSNYVLLAEVAAAASGTPLPDLLKQRVFDPLGLDMVLQPSLQAPDVAARYWTINGALTPLLARWTQLGDKSIYTTPSELARWADNYRTGRLGGPKLLAAVTANAVPKNTQPNPAQYGAGIDIFPDGAFGHLGGWGGHNSFMTTSNDHHTTVAASCNSDNAFDSLTGPKGMQTIW
jgi:CubicO group peptidase (beta-lactamase class C family)